MIARSARRPPPSIHPSLLLLLLLTLLAPRAWAACAAPWVGHGAPGALELCAPAAVDVAAPALTVGGRAVALDATVVALAARVDGLMDRVAELETQMAALRRLPAVRAQQDAAASIQSGVWTRVAHFEQPAGFFAGDMPQAWIESYFTSEPLWIQGNAPAVPQLKDRHDDGQFHVESLDWAALMEPLQRYQLRQKVAKGIEVLDVAFDFVYNGHVVQNTGTSLQDRNWRLENRTVLQDDTTATLSQARSGYFALPYAEGLHGPFRDGLERFRESDESGLLACTGLQSRCGGAGILALSGSGGEIAFPWAPTSPVAHDIAYLHDDVASFGSSKGLITIDYFLRRNLPNFPK